MALETYSYNVDVIRGRKLYGMSGKSLYNGNWVARNRAAILIVEMTREIARHEDFFYRTLNNHENVIRTFGYVRADPELTIAVQEFAELGDLSNMFMDNNPHLTEGVLLEMFLQIANAMKFIASRSVVHGDLGCRNVLVYRIDSRDRKRTLVKLTDFGLARSLTKPEYVNSDASIIPIRYCAPELLRDQGLAQSSEKSDVYSMAVLMWEALSRGEMPYSETASDDEVKSMKLRGVKLSQPQSCYPALWELIEVSWSFDVAQRPNFAHIHDRLSFLNLTYVANLPARNPNRRNQNLSYEFQFNADVVADNIEDGNFGTIFPARWRIKSRADPISIVKIENELTEVEMIFYLGLNRHENIVNILGFVENQFNFTMLLQEQAPHGNLQERLERRQFQPNFLVLMRIFQEINSAMVFLNGKEYIHGNLRCKNVLIFQMDPTRPDKNLIKLTDFSSAHVNKPLIKRTKNIQIPIRYCAWEIIRSAGRQNYSQMSEVYSFGVLMWQALSGGTRPYDSVVSNTEVRQLKLNGRRLTKPDSCPANLWTVIDSCWLLEPRLRFSFSDLEILLERIRSSYVK